MPSSSYSFDRVSAGVDFMSDDSLLKTVGQLEQSNVNLHLENEVFQAYLGRLQPELLLGIQQAVEALEAKEYRILAVASLMNQRTHSIGSSNSLAHYGVGGTSSRASVSRTLISTAPAARESPRIEIAHKIEMASRETEELRKSTAAFRSVSRSAKLDLGATIEGIRLAKSDVKLFTEEFDVKMVREANNARIPAEKLVRFIEVMVKATESETTKLRLKSEALLLAGRRAHARLLLKRELGATLRPVDVHMLRIEAVQKVDSLEKSGVYLSELKGSTAKAKSHFITTKNTLQELEAAINSVSVSIAGRDGLNKALAGKCAAVREEVKVAAGKLSALRKFRSEFFPPDTLDYLRVKSEVATLKKDVKMWLRKKHVQHATLVSYKNRIKTLTRRKTLVADDAEK